MLHFLVADAFVKDTTAKCPLLFWISKCDVSCYETHNKLVLNLIPYSSIWMLVIKNKRELYESAIWKGQDYSCTGTSERALDLKIQ